MTLTSRRLHTYDAEQTALVNACIQLIRARNAGADVFEAATEVRAIEHALQALGITIESSSVATFNQLSGWDDLGIEPRGTRCPGALQP